MKERTKLLLIVLLFLVAYYVPWSHSAIRQAGLEAFMMLQEYAREHVLTCLIPAFFIAGAIAVFVSQASVLKYFGAQANRVLSYSVASISGTIMAVANHFYRQVVCHRCLAHRTGRHDKSLVHEG